MSRFLGRHNRYDHRDAKRVRETAKLDLDFCEALRRCGVMEENSEFPNLARWRHQLLVIEGDARKALENASCGGGK